VAAAATKMKAIKPTLQWSWSVKQEQGNVRVNGIEYVRTDNKDFLAPDSLCKDCAEPGLFRSI